MIVDEMIAAMTDAVKQNLTSFCNLRVPCSGLGLLVVRRLESTQLYGQIHPLLG